MKNLRIFQFGIVVLLCGILSLPLSAQTEVMAWSNITGVRVDGELIDFESSLRVGTLKGDMEITGKEKQVRPVFHREGDMQEVTTTLRGVKFHQKVTDKGKGLVEISIDALSDTTLNQAAYYCIALSPENYVDAKVRTSGRKLTVTSANRKLEFKFNKSIKVTVEKESTGTVVYISLMPILKKLYKDKKDLSEAYQRHLLFFNTQISWGGGTITGIMASLEAARAQEVYMDTPVTIDDDLIYNTKAGLMGALAGIGDSIDSGTIQYIFIAIALPWAQQGNAIGALFPFVMFSLYQLVIGYYFAQLGFKLGRTAATEVVGTKMQIIIEALSILGLFMMGILAANYVKVSSTLAFTLSGKKFVIQEILDGVMPGILPLLTVGLVYFYFD